MMNLLSDTKAAMTYYGKETFDVNGVIFFNEDLNTLQQTSWQDFERFAFNINYDINDGSVTGRRMFKPRFFIVGDDWFLARTTPRDNFEGWVKYDHALEIDQDVVQYVRPTDDTIAFLIADLPALPSDYTHDKDYHSMFETPIWLSTNNERSYNVAHGIQGKSYWTGNHTTNKLPQLLTHPEIIQAVNIDMSSETDFFNNEYLSELFGIDDAGYVHDPRGSLAVAEIPVGHFTVYMGDDGNEVVQSTVDAPYHK